MYTFFLSKKDFKHTALLCIHKIYEVLQEVLEPILGNSEYSLFSHKYFSKLISYPFSYFEIYHFSIAISSWFNFDELISHGRNYAQWLEFKIVPAKVLCVLIYFTVTKRMYDFQVTVSRFQQTTFCIENTCILIKLFQSTKMLLDLTLFL